jgi:CO dehydrogenase/acetyl-CoA synthase alpha subunit
MVLVDRNHAMVMTGISKLAIADARTKNISKEKEHALLASVELEESDDLWTEVCRRPTKKSSLRQFKCHGCYDWTRYDLNARSGDKTRLD